MAEPAKSTRYYSLDALRAAAMELGLLLHAAVPYTRNCPTTWVVCDGSRAARFDLLNSFIHSFRMPVFFLMCGFFAVLLLERVGTRAFIAHRARRIAIPLVVGCLTIVPLTRAIWIYGAFARPGANLPGRYWPSLVAHFEEHGIGVLATLWHLWFLEYLLLMYLAFLAVRWLLARTAGGGLRSHLLDRLCDALIGRHRALVLFVPTAFAMLPMAGWNVDGIGAMRPMPHMLAYYGIFFVAGCLLYRSRSRLDELGAAWQAHFLIGLGVCLPLLVLFPVARPQLPAQLMVMADVAAKLVSAMLTCQLLYGFVGLFIEFASKASPRRRYLSDAAYFIYLTHFPLIALLGIGMAHLSWPPEIKFLTILAITFPALLALYQVAVRHTVIGRTLHGPR